MPPAILECPPSEELTCPATAPWDEEQFLPEFEEDEYAQFDIERDRAERILATKIEFMPSPAFDADDADDEFLGQLSSSTANGVNGKSMPTAPRGTPPYLAALYSIPLLTREQEQHLFRKMNYLKYRAHVLRERLDPDWPQTALLDQIETLLSDALAVRNQIVQANLRLVVSIAKKLVDHANSFEELVSDGNLPLIRAVEIFDFDRGTRFSTYATWAIRNSLYRSAPRNRRHRKRFATGNEIVFESGADDRPSLQGQENYHRELQTAVKRMLSGLDARDQAIVVSRFGLGESDRAHRFREIAARLNISTERVRQLLNRSLIELREMADKEQVELA